MFTQLSSNRYRELMRKRKALLDIGLLCKPGQRKLVLPSTKTNKFTDQSLSDECGEGRFVLEWCGLLTDCLGNIKAPG